MVEKGTPGMLLLVDTCGERGSLALVRGGELLVGAVLPERAASAGLLAAVRQVLASAQVGLSDLSGIGVVNGPGSFTGLRVGLAVCKGLCEAAGLPLAAVSRLKVLASAAGLQQGFAVLRAGRDQVYVRRVQDGCDAGERLMDLRALLDIAVDQELAYAEASLQPLLQNGSAKASFVELRAEHALSEIHECFAHGGTDLALADANYVRDEGAIYARSKG